MQETDLSDHRLSGEGMILFKNLNGWQRLLLLIAVIWAIFVALIASQIIPTQTELEIKAKWISERVELFKKYHKTSESSIELKQQLYGKGTDDEIIEGIIHPNNNYRNTGNFVFATSIPVGGSYEYGSFDTLDKIFKSQLARRQGQSITRILGTCLLVWFVPVAGIYILGKAFFWVYSGFRSDKG